MSYKKILLLIMLLVLIVVLGGCRGAVKTKEAAVTANSYSVIDATGTKLVFAKKPSKIISMNCSIDELLLDMVSADRIAALTVLADNPTISATCEQAKVVKNRVRNNSTEAILALQPDLIIAADWIDLTNIQVFRDIGIPVYVYRTPVTMEEIQQSILDIAYVTGDSKRGKELVKEMQDRLDNVWQRVKDIPPQERKCVIAFSQMGAFGAKGTTLNDACIKANVINGVALTGVDLNESLNKEQIVMVNPDIFLLPTWDEFSRGQLPQYINEIKSDPAYKDTKAVRNKRFIHVDDKYIYSNSHYAAYAVEGLAKAVYPERF